MPGLISQKGFRRLRPDLDTGMELVNVSDFYGGGYGGGGGGSVDAPPAPVSAPVVASSSPSLIQYDLSEASFAAAAARGNVRSDVQSAYDTYISGTPIGRGGKYAVDAARKYGVDIREAARGYLDTAGLWRYVAPPPPQPIPEPVWQGPALPNPELTLNTGPNDPVYFSLPYIDPITGQRGGGPHANAQGQPILDPEPAPDDSGLVTQEEQLGPGNPFQTIAETFRDVFAANQADQAPAPVVVVGDATQQQGSGGGSSSGLILVLLLGGGFAFYWFYLRKKMGGGNGG